MAEVLQWTLGEFFAWMDAMPEIERQEDLHQVNLLTLAGQRGVRDEDYKKAIRDLKRRVRRSEKKLTADEFKKFNADIENLNRLWREVGSAGA